MARLGSSDLDVFPLCLGGNVFGWTADEADSFAVLDGYLGAGGNFIDTADTYSSFAPGNRGGESEAIIGRWQAARGVRERIVIATKVGSWEEHPGLSPTTIRAAIEDSLGRLQTDYVDLYYAHRDDPQTPLEQSLGAFDELVREGKVRAVGLSNFSAARLDEALAVCEREGLAAPVALQPLYNLVERDGFEGALAEVAARAELACLPYSGLARGFLTGKYRPGVSVDSPRAARAASYLEDPRADGLLAAPIASARNAAQLAEILPAAWLELDIEELTRLTDCWS